MDAGDAAEQTDWSCVLPSPSERDPELETVTDVPRGFF